MADEAQAVPSQLASGPPTIATSAGQVHSPAIPSPLNPDTKARPAKPPPREREQREKKDTLKKREANYGRSETPSSVPTKRKAAHDGAEVPSPMRYSIPEPRLADYDAPKATTFASHEPLPFITPDGEIELRKPLDHAENKKGYRYTHCVADPHFKHKQFYRQSETAPYEARFSFEDTDKWINFDSTGHYITNEKGWRMARANVCAREGSLYYEVRVVRGVPAQESDVASTGPKPHVRMGWARREAPLDAPVGYDGYSYGVTDLRFETMHRSRPGKFFTPKAKKGVKPKAGAAKSENTPIELKDNIQEGDVVGLEVTLPSLSLHQKVANGVYNPAVDIGDGFHDNDTTTNTTPLKPEPGSETYDVIRDRIPVPYKGNIFFETMDYIATKPMEAYTDRTISLSAISQSSSQSVSIPGASTAASSIKTAPNPNHVDPPLRTLPHSSIKVYKNGQLIGTAFDNLLAFLPPASAPNKAAQAREGFDDGMVGYFPAVSCFTGGIAEVNFGENGFWHPPSHIKDSIPDAEGQASVKGWRPGRAARPISERYKEQIAEDVVWDIVDEVDFFMQDGGFEGKAGAGAKETRRGVASLKEEVD